MTATLSRLFSLDVRALAALRMGIALLIWIDLATRAPYLRQHYSDLGIVTRADAATGLGKYGWSLHFAFGSVEGQALLFTLAAIVAAGLLVGWHTRICAVASWVLLVSLQARNEPVSYGADAMLRDVLFFALFLPLGAAFSLDAKRAARTAGMGPLVVGIAPAALTLQIGLLYFFTGALKLKDQSWTHLDAVFYALATDHHATSVGLWASQSPVLVRAFAVVTMAMEMLGPLALLIPIGRERVRTVLCLAFIAFHLGLSVMLNVGLFPAVAVVAWMALLPSSVWDRFGIRTAATKGGPPDDRGPRLLPGIGLALIVASNLTSVAPSIKLPAIATAVTQALRLEQRWSMFTRPMSDGWLLAEATLKDGRVVDAMRKGALVDESKPAFVGDLFLDMRWRKLFTGMITQKPSSPKRQRAYLRYLCLAWNRFIEVEDERMLSVDLVFIEERDRPGLTTPPHIRHVLAHRSCERDDRALEGRFGIGARPDIPVPDPVVQ